MVGLLAVPAIWIATLRFDLPSPEGQYAVGRNDGDFEAHARHVAYTLYYPAVRGTGHAGPYMPAAIAQPTAARDLGGFDALADPWARVEQHSADGAVWAVGRFPLIVFSPGADVQPQYYSSMLTELASHGFVVAALSHPGFTPYIAYPDGTMAASQDPVPPSGPQAAMEQFDARIATVADDIQAAVVHIRTDPTTAGHLATSTGAFGHSLGGAAAASAAAREVSIGAVGDMDGSLGAEARGVALKRPVFFFTDDGPVTALDQAARQGFVRGGTVGLKVTLHGAGHMTFATDVNFFEEAIPFNDSDTLGAMEAYRDLTKPLVEFFTANLPS
ncbi:MAG TPA: hypothetical protein VM286_08715 [Candidatus Thermoplasmatota archaeon]|nr:hypothetical protein [Candidatus Thermoplasmatota archaeon]